MKRKSAITYYKENLDHSGLAFSSINRIKCILVNMFMKKVHKYTIQQIISL